MSLIAALRRVARLAGVSSPPFSAAVPSSVPSPLRKPPTTGAAPTYSTRTLKSGHFSIRVSTFSRIDDVNPAPSFCARASHVIPFASTWTPRTFDLLLTRSICITPFSRSRPPFSTRKTAVRGRARFVAIPTADHLAEVDTDAVTEREARRGIVHLAEERGRLLAVDLDGQREELSAA